MTRLRCYLCGTSDATVRGELEQPTCYAHRDLGGADRPERELELLEQRQLDALTHRADKPTRVRSPGDDGKL